MLFQRKKKEKTEKKEYDPAKYKPYLKCSICNGEQVAVFRDLETGEFEEVAFIRNEKELREFKETYGITTEIEKIY